MQTTSPTIQISPEFQLAYQYVTQTRQNIFLTGKAGTGKTTFLQHLRTTCPKNMVVAAPTGVASINAGGVTLHSLFSLPFQPYIPVKRGWGKHAEVIDRDDLLAKVRYRKDKIKLLRNMELLIIDEISMVRADVLDAIDVLLRHFRRRHDLPFGGVQLLLIGDIFQLPPVAKREEWSILQEYYASEFFFDSKVMQEVQPICVQLETIYRQSDTLFIDLLNKVRNNIATADDLTLLNSRLHKGKLPDNCITLTTHNKVADEINAREIEKLPGNIFTFRANIDGDFPEYSFPAEHELRLKNGARVMFIKNDISGQKRYFNGKIGVITKIETYNGDTKIFVQCPDDDEPIAVQKQSWKNVSYKTDAVNNAVIEEELGAFSQFPLRLAWAVTIHKSQGLTFNQCAIDAALSFAGGQLYVALSRCTSFEGLHLLSPIGPAALRVHQAVTNYFNHLHPEAAKTAFDSSQAKYAEELLLQLFDFNEEHTIVLRMSTLLQENRMNFSANQADTINLWYQNISELKQIGEKFHQQIKQLIHTAPAENNPLLQERIKAAKTFFLPKVDFVLHTLLQHGIVIDSKTISADLSPLLDDFHNALCIKVHFYKSQKDFTSANFFAVREDFVRPDFNSNTFAGGTKGYVPKDVPHPELYRMLIDLRNELVEETGKEVFNIAKNSSIIEMCEYLPLTGKDLLSISGFGQIKVKLYGEQFLSIIIEYALQNRLSTKMAGNKNAGKAKLTEEKNAEKKRIKENKEKNGVSETVKTSLDLVADGMTVDQVAKQRSFSPETIYGHLAQGITLGKIAIDKILPISEIEYLSKVVKENPSADLKTLRENAGVEYGFGKIKLIVEHVKRAELS